MSKKQEKAKPVFQSCNIKFPERVWEQTENGWTSRPATADDLKARRAAAESIGAVIVG